ncbi:ComEA family DNA-binding protein [Pedobacter sp. PACM 27299]|uniref:ComEA family DNA-binding protein n=1 Tax=Pedobacter sp. PACM 27299 TaxID=1727164 RepID=UPI0012F9419F|nr:helix-hairpin-helix domain-containing protein [Pedobacter sp. PACM 27299]
MNNKAISKIRFIFLNNSNYLVQVIRKWLNNYFQFSKREFNGLLVLIVLIGMIAVFPTVYRILVPLEGPTVEEQLALLKLELSKEPERVEARSGKHRSYSGLPEKRKSTLFYFDPNSIPSEGWQDLGLSPKQAQAILNYRVKGGVFRLPSDLKKMYTIAPELYQQLEPYIQIVPVEKGADHRDRPAQNFPVKEKVVVALNTADTLELDRIYGIGKVFARRIVAYREKIGGFYKKEQLLEVFGIDSLKYEEIKDQVSVNPALLRMIHINTASAADFNRHPYLSYQQVNAVIAYRKQHGNYSNIADLNKVVILTPELIEKLAPYLIF